MTSKENPRQAGGLAGGNSNNSACNSTPSPVDKLLSRLDKVRSTDEGKWTACCPAHEDRSPSLSIRETSDGTVLVKCWTGCGAAEIVSAVGLTLADLFPEPPENPHSPGQRRPWRDAAGEAFRALAADVAIIHLAGASVAKGFALAAADRERVALAVARVRDALHLIDGGRHG